MINRRFSGWISSYLWAYPGLPSQLGLRSRRDIISLITCYADQLHFIRPSVINLVPVMGSTGGNHLYIAAFGKVIQMWTRVGLRLFQTFLERRQLVQFLFHRLRSRSPFCIWGGGGGGWHVWLRLLRRFLSTRTIFTPTGRPVRKKVTTIGAEARDKLGKAKEDKGRWKALVARERCLGDTT